MKTSRMIRALAAVAVAATLATGGGAAADDTKLTIMVFQGMQNLPLLAAQAKGLFAKHGLSVDIKIAPNSDEQRAGLADGRFQIIHCGGRQRRRHGGCRQGRHRGGDRRRQRVQSGHRAARRQCRSPTCAARP